MECKGNWVDDTTFRLNQYLKDINEIWTKIGYSDRHHVEKQRSLTNEVSILLQNTLSSAEKAKAEIELKIHELKVSFNSVIYF